MNALTAGEVESLMHRIEAAIEPIAVRNRQTEGPPSPFFDWYFSCEQLLQDTVSWANQFPSDVLFSPTPALTRLAGASWTVGRVGGPYRPGADTGNFSSDTEAVKSFIGSMGGRPEALFSVERPRISVSNSENVNIGNDNKIERR